MPLAKTSQSYQQFMEGTLIPGIRKMQETGLAFLSFGVIGISIEVLGSFFDRYPLDQERLSKKRFNAAIDQLFAGLGKEYRNCPHTGTKHDDYCLYAGLRCGMAHIGRPQGKIAFTTRGEALADKNGHLVRDVQGTLILVAEDLADDFQSAWSALKTLSANGKTQKKVTEPYLTITSY